MIEILNEFVKRRNAAIESNSIKEFDSFMEWAHQVGMYDDEHYKQWQLFDKDMKLRIINKMATACENISNERKEKAHKWLKEHDSKPLC